jgi:hypothetical protein
MGGKMTYAWKRIEQAMLKPVYVLMSDGLATGYLDDALK